MSVEHDEPARWPTGEMAGLQFVAAGRAEWMRVPVPGERTGHVLVEVERLGICGTDEHLHSGHSAYIRSGLTTYPFQPGHEFVGRVVAVAPGVRSVAVGDRVVGEPFLPCLACPVCRSGAINLCPNRAEQGVRGNVPGAAARYVRTPAANLAVVPEGVGPDAAVLAEPSVTALGALEAIRVMPGDEVAVIGTGTIGLLVVQIASALGARVTAVGIDEHGLARAEECGAVAIARPEEAPSDRFDATVEASGATPALLTASRITGPGGRIAQVGIPGGADVPVDGSSIVAKGLTITGVLGGVAHLSRAVGLIAAGVIRPELLIRHVIGWEDAPDAFGVPAGDAKPKVLVDLSALARDDAAALGVGVGAGRGIA
ncbi:zinc-binding dehydrogenase [Herbiconiux sp. A18JL235]|uniref:Zinc-binding dehydrogenase n=1 Tax=Herbiconiux sp. A18JL235 TaxID=3152363 RepID=A0AB39BIM8_9MICO